MAQINLNSISGITSITTRGGMNDVLTLHNNNTTEAVKLDGAGNLHFHNHLNITGVSSASNFKTGSTNVHSTGVELANINTGGGTATFGGKISIGGTELISNSGTYLHIKTNANEDMAKFQKDGGSFLYFNNQLRLETKQNGIDVQGRVTASNGFYGDGSNLSGITGTTINNNADNRVITGSGTANTLEGESGFTFDGTTVQVPDRINYNTNGSYLKENQLQFKPSGTAYIDHGTTNQDIQIRMSTSSSLDTTGPTFKSNGNLAFAAGKGIDFSADGNNSGMDTEVLDDYEEGSWSAIPSSGGTFTGCRYVKVGSLCLVTGSVSNLPTHSNSVIEIYGLPFQNRNTGALGQVTYHGSLRGYNMGSNAGNSRPPTNIVLENSRLYIGTSYGNGGWELLQYNEMSSSTNAIQFNVTYQTT